MDFNLIFILTLVGLGFLVALSDDSPRDRSAVGQEGAVEKAPAASLGPDRQGGEVRPRRPKRMSA